jgi:transcriptional antiterminator NusG
MSLQDPQDQYERNMEETKEEETPVESPMTESDSPVSEDESGALDVPASEAVEPSEEDRGSDEEMPAESEPLPIPAEEASVSDAAEGPAWYVIHCYSGYENKVRHNLEQRIETMGMKDRIFDVVIPTQEEIEVKDGKRRTVERHIFPGYVLVNMLLTEESWYVVRNTPGVTGFVGMGNNPTPLRPEEVSQIIKRMEAEAPTVKVTYKVGERVRIIDGPFNDFRGMVSEIDMERTKVRVMVSFFGRETPVELDFLQVEKA